MVVCTSTASGKSVCYNVPILEALGRDPEACALYMFPTKALAQVCRDFVVWVVGCVVGGVCGRGYGCALRCVCLYCT